MRFVKLALILAVIATLAVSRKLNIDRAYICAERKADDVLRLSVCADACIDERRNLLMSFGHAFISVENLSDKGIFIYDSELLPGESVTFSWWAVDKHMGIWFNIEPNYIIHGGRYKNVRTVCMYINPDEVQILNRYLKEHDSYSPLGNCSKHVTECWNILAENSEKIESRFIMTPQRLISEINKFESAADFHTENCNEIYYILDGVRHIFILEK